MLLFLLACRVLPPKIADDTGEAARSATAWVGDAGALLRASASLRSGDRWVAADGAAITLLDEATAFAAGAGPFSLVDADGAALGAVAVVPVSLSVSPEALLLDPDEAGLFAMTAANGAPLTFFVDGTAAAAQADGADLSAAFSFEGAAAGPILAHLAFSLAPAGHPELPVATAAAALAHTGQRLVWGDLHSHSNLSHDGCEDPDADCLPRGATPALDAFDQAAAAGLDFAAITEHAEWEAWIDHDTDQEVGIWSEAQRLVAAASGGPVLPLLGYEWTGAYEGGGHRTVLFAEAAVCADRFVRAQDETGEKLRANGIEGHRASVGPLALTPRALLDSLAAPADCSATSLSYFHHSAYKMPRMVTWTAADNEGLDDRLVEIYSEHGSSECRDPRAPNCDFGLNADFFKADGSVQTALSLGLDLGFVGGTDNHNARPGSVGDGPSGIYSAEGYKPHFTAGALTLASLPSADPLDAMGLFAALEARHTGAATFRAAQVAAGLSCAGQLYLPGDTVPAGDCLLLVHFADSALESLEIDLIDRAGAATTVLPDGEGRLLTPVNLAAGDLVYLRLRPTLLDASVHRIWLSPWFASD